MADSPTILDAMAAFRGWFSGLSWDAWRALLAALFGLPMTEDQLAFYRHHTGRTMPPSGQAREGHLVIGRRGGKSLIAALVAVFAACFCVYRGILAHGERGIVMVVAADRRQARVVFRYICGLLDAPALQQLIARRTAESIDLTNGITIEVHTASWRTTRGYTVVCFIGDEVAFWRNEENGANPDREILNAIRPAMLTVPGALLLSISSPYARSTPMSFSFGSPQVRPQSVVTLLAVGPGGG